MKPEPHSGSSPLDSPSVLVRATRGVLVGVIRLYQVTLGPFLGGRCRFEPSCSAYGVDAIEIHGALKGSWLTIRRLLRCQPFGGHGYDPVPPLSADTDPPRE